MKHRLDQILFDKGLVQSRSAASNYIKLGYIKVNGKIIQKSGELVDIDSKIDINLDQQYVSRAALKLDSVATSLGIVFKHKVVLDVGSSTGGFTDYALRHGSTKVIAVDVGSNQLHPSLRDNSKVELHEKTDIRDFITDTKPDIILADVSFISLSKILPKLKSLSSKDTILVLMVKPQFEATRQELNKGVIKNEKIRRQVLRRFEDFARKDFVILKKADSGVKGQMGNLERFYLLKPIIS